MAEGAFIKDRRTEILARDGDWRAARPVAAAAARLAEIAAEHPELAAYTCPATAGDIAEVAAKLDEVADLLRRLLAVVERR